MSQEIPKGPYTVSIEVTAKSQEVSVGGFSRMHETVELHELPVCEICNWSYLDAEWGEEFVRIEPDGLILCVRCSREF